MAELFELSRIYPNPYQPREAEDPEHVKKIALSIAEKGLLQTPVGRRVDGHIQLAFGHSRLAAFRWLVDVQPTSSIEGDFTAMPVDVRELSDLQMFELGIAENIARKDLTPVEEAKAMLRYKTEFGKSSEEIGQLFGVNASTARGKMRLVELPEPVQQKLAAGAITEGQARELLTAARVVPAEKVVEIADKVVADPSRAARVMEEVLDESRGAVKMWEAWRGNDEPKGGDDLWPLTWTWEGYKYPNFKIFERFWKGPEYDDLKAQYEHAHRHLDFLRFGEKPGLNFMIEREPASREDVQEAVKHLFCPPACTACPFYARHGGNHYCGARTCWERKKEAWAQGTLELMSKQLGIAIYNPEEDGKLFEDGSDWNRRQDFERWFEKKEKFLRLRLKSSQYAHSFTKSHLVQLISVGPASLKRLKQAKEAASSQEAADRIRRETEAQQKQVREQSEAFLKTVAIPVFAQVFKPLKRGVLLDLARNISYYNVDESAADMAASVVSRLFENRMVSGNLRYQGPVAVAEHLAGVAITWGIELPSDWMEIARRYAEGEVESE